MQVKQKKILFYLGIHITYFIRFDFLTLIKEKRKKKKNTCETSKTDLTQIVAVNFYHCYFSFFSSNYKATHADET